MNSISDNITDLEVARRRRGEAACSRLMQSRFMFDSYHRRLAEIARLGKFERFIEDFQRDGVTPEWVIEVIFDREAPEDRHDFANWEWENHDWLIHDHSPPPWRWTGDNLYRNAVAWTIVSPEMAEEVFEKRSTAAVRKRFGRYNTTTQARCALGWDHFRYERAALKNGDIRSHPRHDEMFHRGRRFMLLLINERDAFETIRNDEEMVAAQRVYERCRRKAIFVNSNVVDLLNR